MDRSNYVRAVEQSFDPNNFIDQQKLNIALLGGDPEYLAKAQKVVADLQTRKSNAIKNWDNASISQRRVFENSLVNDYVADV